MPVPVLQSSYCLLASKRSLDVEMTAGQFAFFFGNSWTLGTGPNSGHRRILFALYSPYSPMRSRNTSTAVTGFIAAWNVVLLHNSQSRSCNAFL